MEIQIDKQATIIETVYRPNTPPKADLDIFMHTMSELKNMLRSEKQDAYIMGDVNINLLNFNEHSKTNDYLEDIFSSGFIPLITKPSRVTPYSATLLDHIYTNKHNIETASGIVISDLSDHFGIFTILTSPHKKKHRIPINNYSVHIIQKIQIYLFIY